jgi:hypothetical protein
MISTEIVAGFPQFTGIAIVNTLLTPPTTHPPLKPSTPSPALNPHSSPHNNCSRCSSPSRRVRETHS